MITFTTELEAITYANEYMQNGGHIVFINNLYIVGGIMKSYEERRGA